MASPLELLIVEDRPDDAELVVAELRRAGYEPQWTRVETPEQFLAGLAADPHVVICDYSLPLMTAPDALTILRDLHSDIPLIVVSGVMDEETCVNSLRLGAVDYLLKDRLVRLGPAIDHALAALRLARDAHRARREWRETSDILRGLVDHSPAAIAVRDATGRSLVTNAEYDRLAAAALANPNGSVPPPRASAQGISAEDRATLDGRRIIEKEEAFLLDGERRTYLSVKYPVIDDAGRAFAVGSLYLDITRQKQVEEDLRELDRLKTDFIATVSHELRTPLTSICGYAELLVEEGGAGDDQGRRMIGVIERNGRRLLSLVEDLLILSRVDSGAFSRNEQSVDLGELAASARTVLEPAAQSARVEVDLDVEAGLPAVVGDRSQLERVLLNLVSNAVKFSQPDSRVLIAVRRAGTEVVLTVQDHGIGIPTEELPRLFTRFFRSSIARERVIQGTGLGLAVVKEIVERHGGTISVESEPGAGATLTVRLPVATAEVSRPVDAGSPDRPAEAAGGPSPAPAGGPARAG